METNLHYISTLESLVQEQEQKIKHLRQQLDEQVLRNKRLETEVQAQESVFIQIYELHEALEKKNKEIEKQKQELSLLNDEVVAQNEEIRQYLEEIETQRDYLVELNEELNQQKEEIQTTTQQLAEQHQKISVMLTDLQDSINYAQRIQTAILPKATTFQNFFSDYFIFYQPRDVVSGDFYWATEVSQRRLKIEEGKSILANKKQIFVVADCTGHGVPGAFMSMIGINLLNQAIIDKQIHQAQHILWAVDAAIKILLKKGENDNQDGMDMALVVIDKEKQTLEFAGAKRPLIYFQDGELKEIKGTSKSIGGHQKETARFEQHEISIQDTVFYLFSDGYADQIGGRENRKFMIKRFRELLVGIQGESLEKQGKILEQEHLLWKGKEKQIDDILVAGFRVS